MLRLDYTLTQDDKLGLLFISVLLYPLILESWADRHSNFIWEQNRVFSNSISNSRSASISTLYLLNMHHACRLIQEALNEPDFLSLASIPRHDRMVPAPSLCRCPRGRSGSEKGGDSSRMCIC